MTTEEQIAALRAEMIDIGLSRDLEKQEGIEVRTLFREPLLASIFHGAPSTGGDGVTVTVAG